LTARKQLVVRATGKVSGKVRYGKVAIEEGGEISGDIAALPEAKGAGVSRAAADPGRSSAATPAVAQGGAQPLPSKPAWTSQAGAQPQPSNRQGRPKRARNRSQASRQGRPKRARSRSRASRQGRRTELRRRLAAPGPARNSQLPGMIPGCMELQNSRSRPA